MNRRNTALPVFSGPNRVSAEVVTKYHPPVEKITNELRNDAFANRVQHNVCRTVQI
jgi:hypothetical protein